MYHKKANHWDARLLISGLILGGLIILLSSWVEVATEHTVDYHVDTQTDNQRDDQNGKNDAQSQSESEGYGHYTDTSGNDHVYLDGKEIN